MTNKTSFQNQLAIKIGEVAYTSAQVTAMLFHLGICKAGESQIRKYVKENNLALDLRQLGMKSAHPSPARYIIPKSNLASIIDGLGYTSQRI